MVKREHDERSQGQAASDGHESMKDSEWRTYTFTRPGREGVAPPTVAPQRSQESAW